MRVTLPDSFFRTNNPYRDVVQEDSFDYRGRVHHIGEVYLDGAPLLEAGPRRIRDQARPRRQLVEITVRHSCVYPASRDATSSRFVAFTGVDAKDSATHYTEVGPAGAGQGNTLPHSVCPGVKARQTERRINMAAVL